MAKATTLFAAFCLLLLATAAHAEKRLGWIDGIKDFEQYLSDSEGQWTISKIATSKKEKDYRAQGAEKLVDPKGPNYIEVIPHTYYCAYLNVTTDKAQKRILSIESVKVVEPHQCLNDKNIDKPSENAAERVAKDNECFSEYVNNASLCNEDFPSDEARFNECLRPVKIHGRRCCKMGTPKCADDFSAN